MEQKLTKEKALELYRKMWSDMQRDLGDNPNAFQRINYKMDWCDQYFPDQMVTNSCFLCEYTSQQKIDCKHCPIVWGEHPSCCTMYNEVQYDISPISKILALSERKEVTT